jgi:hypothetical protein
MPTVPDLLNLDNGELVLALHPGQQRAWDSEKRFVVVLAGTQGGKTSFGPPWLFREIKHRGPGDYMVVTPTFPLLEVKALPSFRSLFEKQLRLGEYQGHPVRKFTFSNRGKKFMFGPNTDLGQDTIVYFGHAQDPESLESATAKAAWLDEAGQSKFRLGSFEAILRRLSLHQGRILISTTPYNLAWLKTHLYDPWKAQNEHHPEIDIIRFDSTENPSFPPAEFERARRDLPDWKFKMFYQAIFTRPVGQIYDCFDEATMKIARRELPTHWRRYLGLDFGAVNTAGVFFAEDPENKRLYAYREYHAGGRTAKQHVEALLAGEPVVNGRVIIPYAVGGAKSEQNWRDEFRAAGLPVQETNLVETSVAGRVSSAREVGINRVYAAFQKGELLIFNDLQHTLDDIRSYSRKTDEAGNVTEEIDDPHSAHWCDCIRYLVAHVRQEHMKFEIGLPDPRRGQGSLIMQAPEGLFPDVDEQRRRKKIMRPGPDGRLRDRWAEPWEPDWNSEY